VGSHFDEEALLHITRRLANFLFGHHADIAKPRCGQIALPTFLVDEAPDHEHIVAWPYIKFGSLLLGQKVPLDVESYTQIVPIGGHGEDNKIVAIWMIDPIGGLEF